MLYKVVLTSTCFGYFLFYSFDALEPGVVVAKECNADILPPIDGLSVQAPPGLDTARQTYVFEKIREFCDKEAMDITFPAPKSRTVQKIPLFTCGSDGPVISTFCSASIQMTLS